MPALAAAQTPDDVRRQGIAPYSVSFEIRADVDVALCRIRMPGQQAEDVPMPVPPGERVTYTPESQCAALEATELCATCGNSDVACYPIEPATIDAARARLAQVCAERARSRSSPRTSRPAPRSGSTAAPKSEPQDAPRGADCVAGRPEVSASALPAELRYVPTCGTDACEGRVIDGSGRIVLKVRDPGRSGSINLRREDLALLRRGAVAAVTCFFPDGRRPQGRVAFDFGAALASGSPPATRQTR